MMKAVAAIGACLIVQSILLPSVLARSVPVVDGSLRLVDGANSREGRVEIFHSGKWGTICDDAWGLDDAHVVCRQLGFGPAVAAKSKAHFGSGRDPIWLDNVACTGSEARLINCKHSGLGTHNCGHYEDAGVVCAADMARIATVTSIRLVGGKNQYEGRVEVLINGQWGTVCDDGFDVNDAKVVCRQLGYGDAVAVKGKALFGQGSTSILLDNMECSGSESSLSGCLHAGTGTHNCAHYEDVGVVCAVPTVDGSLRLVDGANSSEGRVEIFHSGEWGTICDDAWGLDDAHVVCRQLGFGPAVAAKSAAHFGSGRDPIWLDDVACTGLEARLINCKHSGLGTYNCVHNEDAGVICDTRIIDDTSGSGIPIDDMVLGPWGEYDSCTATCDGGRQTRTRSCSGMGCDEVDTTETRLCNIHCCPVNGGWTEYGPDGPCSTVCGMGTKSFTRHCTEPRPFCGGKPCDGPIMEERKCNLDPCDIQPNRALTEEEIHAILNRLFGGKVSR